MKPFLPAAYAVPGNPGKRYEMRMPAGGMTTHVKHMQGAPKNALGGAWIGNPADRLRSKGNEYAALSGFPFVRDYRCWKSRPKGGKAIAMGNHMGRARVYVLVCPESGERRYVGQTRCSPKTRLRWHFRNLNNRVNRGMRLSPVMEWLKELKSKGLKPYIVILDNEAKWDISEAVWIDRLTRDGQKLLNVASRVS